MDFTYPRFLGFMYGVNGCLLYYYHISSVYLRKVIPGGRKDMKTINTDT